MRERAPDYAGVEALYQQAANAGLLNALIDLARLREEAGDQASSEAIRRFCCGARPTPV